MIEDLRIVNYKISRIKFGGKMGKIILVFILLLSIQLYSQPIKLEQKVVYKGNFIGSIGQVALDSKEQVYIGDFINHDIHIFSPTGKYIKQIGREGKGPGEFQYIWGLQIGQKDSLYVLDGNLNRITVFTPNQFDYPAYTIALDNGPNGEAITGVGWHGFGANGLWVNKNSRIFVAYQEYYSKANLNKQHHLKIFIVNRKGEIVYKTSLINIKGMDRLINVSKGFMVSIMPFGQTPVVHLGPDGYFYFGNSDIFDIKAIDVSGNLKRELKYEVKPVRIKQSMWDKALENYEYLTQKSLNNSLTPLPDYKRLFDDFVIDEKGNIWVETNTTDENNYTWMVFDKSNNLITKFKFPKSVMLKIIKQNYAYGIYTDDNGIQSVIKYEIKTK